MLTVDLNCDLGEGCGNDAELMKFISSANIACGEHAGDAGVMRETVRLALANNVVIGAHPGYRDRENFGRIPMTLSRQEVIDLVAEQIEALRGICKESGAELHHVKPHGALYNQAANNSELAAAVAEAVSAVDRDLVLYGLSGSCLITEGRAAGLATASEVFADRTYRADGTLTPRNEPNALITDTNESVAQVLEMLTTRSVTASTGVRVPLSVDTVCLHGDGEHAVVFARTLRRTLEERGVAICAVDK